MAEIKFLRDRIGHAEKRMDDIAFGRTCLIEAVNEGHAWCVADAVEALARAVTADAVAKMALTMMSPEQRAELATALAAGGAE